MIKQCLQNFDGVGEGSFRGLNSNGINTIKIQFEHIFEKKKLIFSLKFSAQQRNKCEGSMETFLDMPSVLPSLPIQPVVTALQTP